MANKHKGEVSLQVGSETYTMRLSVNALCNLEEASGKPINEVIGDLNQGSSIKLSILRMLVRAALSDHHPNVDINKAGEIMDSAGTAYVVEKLTEALTTAFPEAKAADANPK